VISSRPVAGWQATVEHYFGALLLALIIESNSSQLITISLDVFGGEDM
jgi:hypothetical protein